MSEAALLPRIEAFDTREALVDAAAAAIAEALSRAQDSVAHASFLATGGSTPAPVYVRLSQAPLDWSMVGVTLTDERCVAPDSPDSNERMLRESLLVGPASAARFTPLRSGGKGAPDAGIERLLPFDVVLLGVGEDGHIASLFPGSPALAEGLDPEGARLCIEAPAGRPAPPQPRISLTLRALLSSRLILILATGEAKRRVIEGALAGDDLPVRAVLAQDRVPVRILWSA